MKPMAFELSSGLEIPYLISIVSTLFQAIPLVFDLLLYFTIFLGITKNFFRDEYSIQTRLLITFLMTFAFMFFEIKTEQTLLSVAGYLSIGVILLAAGMFYLLINSDILGWHGSLGLSFAYAYFFSAGMFHDLAGKPAIFLNIILGISLIYGLARIVIHILRIMGLSGDEKL
jgi:hypothetical protein